MDIKKSLKTKIISSVLDSLSTSDWSVLVYDNSCARLLQNIFTKSDFINYNIVMSQDINEEREKTEFPVIYFVRCTSSISKIINNDFKMKKYTNFIVCSIIEPEDLDENINYKPVFVNFVAIEDRVFCCDLKDLFSVGDTLNTYFYVEYTSKTLENECEQLDLQFKEYDRTGKIFVFDRNTDLFTPLIHFYTFQALLEDQNLIDKDFYEEFGDMKVWREIRYIHFGDMSDVLKSYVRNITSNSHKLKGDIQTKDLMKLVMDAPETYKTNDLLKKAFVLTKSCFDKFEYLENITYAEQNLVTGKDKSKKKIKTNFKDLMKILTDKKIEKIDKQKLIFLFLLTKNEIPADYKRNLIKNHGFDENDFILNKSCDLIPYDIKYDYDVSRFEPKIISILREYLKNKKKLINFYKLDEEKKSVQSLRKSNLISIKKNINNEKVYCLYIKGGITYAEICGIHKLSEELGVEFVIGSNRIFKGGEFLDFLREN